VSELPDDFETWCLDMIERVENRLVRNEVEWALREMIGELLRLAGQEEESAVRQWAGELLANIYEGIRKYDRELRKVNAGYGDELGRFAGKSVTSALFPRYVGKIVERELRVVEGYRREIPFLIEGLEGDWKQEVPEKYWCVQELEEFSLKSLEQWWVFLWPVIKEKMELSKMAPLVQRDYATGEIKARSRYLADSQRNAHDHLELLARLSDEGRWVLTPAWPGA
jgi:hypothetical protein